MAGKTKAKVKKGTLSKILRYVKKQSGWLILSLLMAACTVAGTLYLPEETRSITIFACVEAEATDRRIYDYVAEPDTTGQMQELLSYVKEHAVQYRDIRVTGEDSVVALSTCAESATNGRVVLFGKLEKVSE